MALGAQIVAELHGLAEADAFLAEIVRRGENAQPLMQAIGLAMEMSTKERIGDTNVSPDGQPWKVSRRASIDGGRTLYDRGGLNDSITSAGSATEARWGTNKIHGPIHQTGGTIRPKTKKALHFSIPGGGFVTVAKVVIPARPYLGISAADQVEIAGIVEDYFFAGMTGTA